MWNYATCLRFNFISIPQAFNSFDSVSWKVCAHACSLELSRLTWKRNGPRNFRFECVQSLKRLLSHWNRQQRVKSRVDRNQLMNSRKYGKHSRWLLIKFLLPRLLNSSVWHLNAKLSYGCITRNVRAALAEKPNPIYPKLDRKPQNKISERTVLLFNQLRFNSFICSLRNQLIKFPKKKIIEVGSSWHLSGK